MTNHKKVNEEHYNPAFYDNQAEKSYESAGEVLQILFDIHRPNSIVDFGCGQGTWLAAAERLGVRDLMGFDGDWVDRDKLYSKSIDFNNRDLEKDIRIERKFDLAVSLEVAEHLTSQSAETFVNSICSASDIVLFGAAIKGQTGINHINEQWQSYWIELFRSKNYQCFDVIRPQIWDNQKVEWWYKQNTFLFVKIDTLNESASLSRMLRGLGGELYDVVHPENFKYRSGIESDQQRQIIQKNKIIQLREDELREKDGDIQTISEQLRVCELDKNHVSLLLKQSENLIQAMQKSEFWKMRNRYIDIKKDFLHSIHYPKKLFEKYFRNSQDNKLIMTLLVRDEIDIIEDNIRYHLKHGVDFIIATDNGSKDGTREILQKYENRGVLFLIDEPAQDYSQAVWVNRMGKIAFERFGAKNLFHCDADEFWHSKSGSLKNEIQGSANKVLKVDVVNVLLSDKGGKESFPGDAIYAVTNPIIADNFEEQSKNNNLYLFKYPSKVIMNSFYRVGMGNHDIVNGSDITRGHSKDILVYHYPIRGKKHFYQKVINGGGSYRANKVLKKSVGFHWRRWYDAYESNKLDEEYKKLVLCSDDASKLSKKGIINSVSYDTITK